ncbi:TRAP transporter, DctM subunit [Lutimaribacter pacificus]|uniref:TRAP transporter large permease protein n=1 Tax=Lutimaribacter pacificus TaxID=391948 RepID=A0A1H0L4T8_9RHOB|nr:TRAP transporter large permease subunit [Lutimaribacter pacificus]SDO63294.1 TRAP transporter, DctM subunit [Lutimaribacter pacificus]SHK70816.1 TRAP transporter, DctM subunit [Lutimaribacter pacificus]
MSDLAIGGLGIASILVLLALRVQIAFALGIVSFIGIMLVRGWGAALSTVGTLPFSFASSWELSAVPMFLLMGAAAFQMGLTANLFRATRLWMNSIPGGLAVTTNITAAGFAAASGSSVATSAAVGRLAIPEMLRFGYDKGLATGTVAASGTLGALIPPSIAFVIYGWYTGQSVSLLLMAGLIPGLLTAGIYSAMIIGRCIRSPELAPKVAQTVTWKEKFEALASVWPMPVLILAVIGSIYSGIATPTEAGAVAAAFAFIIGASQGNLTWKSLRHSLDDTMNTTASLFFIAIGALLLTRFLAMAGVPEVVSETVASLELSKVQLVIAMALVFLVLGMFLDPIGVMLLTLPIFLPTFEALDMDLIWIGVIVVKMVEVGVLTPPVGINVYVVKTVAGDSVPLTAVFRGVVWFLACEIVIISILIAYPAVSLWLPQLMTH